jgi:DNA-directed RNA polymerase specialized sigma24 family protein
MAEKRDEGADFESALAQALPVVYHRLVSRYRDQQLADEVSGDCMAAAWEKWAGEPDYFLRHDLVGWACRRAAWKAVDRLRQRARSRPLPDEGDEAAGWGGVAAVPPRHEDEARQRARDVERLLAALEQLPEPERRAVVGYHFDDRSDQDVGAGLFEDGASPQAHGLRAWRLRHKAYVRLRALLVQEGVDAGDWGGPGVLAV